MNHNFTLSISKMFFKSRSIILKSLT